LNAWTKHQTEKQINIRAIERELDFLNSNWREGRNLHGQPSPTHGLQTTSDDQEFYLLTHVDPLQTT